jgi:hypothetical protein
MDPSNSHLSGALFYGSIPAPPVVQRVGGDLVRDLLLACSNAQQGNGKSKSDQILQYMTAAIEKLHAKVERSSKIRLLFKNQSAKMVQIVMDHVKQVSIN